MRALTITDRESTPAVVVADDLQPAAGQVRVAVEAASINGFDLAVAGGYVWDLMPHTFPVVLGRDFAGTVDAVGGGVEGTQEGDRVAGVITAMELGPGPIAEQVIVDAALLTAVPSSVTAVQATAVGLAGITALDSLDALSVGAGDVLLVSGATGGVGAFAVQLGAARGAVIVATARPGEATDFVRSLGAADTVDYTGDLRAAVQAVAPDGVTKVLHAAGDPAVLGSVLASGGQLVSVLGATAEQTGRDDITVTAVRGTYMPDKLEALLEEVAAGRLTVPIAATYSLATATQALADFATGKLGKIVVTMP